MLKKLHTTKQIVETLDQDVLELVEWATGLTDENFFKSVNGKWSAGQQIEHLRKSSKPLVLALRLPGFVLGVFVGKANRPSRSYAEVKEKYKMKLQDKLVGPNRFYPDSDLKKSKQKIINDYLATSKKLMQVIPKWQEADLDKYILPHPLLGKVTVREMLFFTIYHTRHHYDNLKELYD